MALIKDGIRYANLEEQVQINKDDIQTIKTSGIVLSEFGIRILEHYATVALLPTVEQFKLDHPNWQYGDSVAIGPDVGPQDLYIMTRADSTHLNDYWLPVGEFPRAGEQGPKGDPGEDGEDGTDGINGTNGTCMFYTSTAIASNTTSVNLSTISIPSGYTLKAGDFLLGNENTVENGHYIARVTAVVSPTATILPMVFIANGITEVDATYNAGDGLDKLEDGPVEWSFHVLYDNDTIDLDSSNRLKVNTNNIQHKLTAGQNITIQNNVISATGGGSSYTAGYGINIEDDEISVDTDTIATVEDLDDKQDVLTAGSNITINNNTISATDTTYSAGDGLDLTETSFSVKIGEGLFFDSNDAVCLNAATRNTLAQVANKYDASNPSGFITKAVNDLTNYYKKTETYTQTEVNNLIAAIEKLEVVVADSLPTASAATMNKLYLIPSATQTAQHAKDEYITIRSGSEGSYTYAWEQIGTTTIDLSNYYTKSQTEDLISESLEGYASEAWVEQNFVDNGTHVSDIEAIELKFEDYRTAAQQNEIDALKQDQIIAGTNIALGPDGKTVSVTGLATVATSGSYNDLSNKPTIPENRVFNVIYGTTAYADVVAAHNAGKVLKLSYSGQALTDDYMYGGGSFYWTWMQPQTSEQITSKEVNMWKFTLSSNNTWTYENNIVGGSSSAPENMVTTDTEQTISGAKTFTNATGISYTQNNKTVRFREDGIYNSTDNQLYKYPSSAGTLALTSQIPTIPTNHVTTNTSQDITAVKSFTAGLNVGLSAYDSTNFDSSQGILILTNVYNGVSKTWTFPSGKEGTVALTSDIPTNISSFTNDSGYITSNALSTYAQKTASNTFTGANAFSNQIMANGGMYIPKTANLTSDTLLAGSWGDLTLRWGDDEEPDDAYLVLKQGKQLGEDDTFLYTKLKVSDSAPESVGGANILTLPSSTGTLALTSDIPSTSNMVTTDTSQTISGNKTFTGSQTNMKYGRILNSGTTDTRINMLQLYPSSGAHSTDWIFAVNGTGTDEDTFILTLPNCTGTLICVTNPDVAAGTYRIQKNTNGTYTFVA